MADHTVNSMAGAIRAMRDVVLPAVDPAHPLAREQAGLVLKYLTFWAERVDHLASRDLAELSCYLRMADALQSDATAVSAELGRVMELEASRAREIAGRAPHDITGVKQAVTALTRVVTALVRAAAETRHEAMPRIERLVVEHSRDVALLQRSWFGPQGWEDPRPPRLEDVLPAILDKEVSA